MLTHSDEKSWIFRFWYRGPRFLIPLGIALWREWEKNLHTHHRLLRLFIFSFHGLNSLTGVGKSEDCVRLYCLLWYSFQSWTLSLIMSTTLQNVQGTLIHRPTILWSQVTSQTIPYPKEGEIVLKEVDLCQEMTSQSINRRS